MKLTAINPKPKASVAKLPFAGQRDIPLGLGPQNIVENIGKANINVRILSTKEMIAKMMNVLGV